MADGARADVFTSLLERGDLPNISKYIVDRGSYRDAVSVFPSTTGPAYTPYILGKYPGRCNLPGIRWFDRYKYNDRSKLLSFERFRSYIGLETYFMNSDVTRDNKSVFEIFPRSVNILNELSRGVKFRNDRTRFSKLYYKVKSHFTDKTDEVDQAARKILLHSLKELPDYVYAVFLGIDTYSHVMHPFHKTTIDSYRMIDETVGAAAKFLENEGRLDETLLVVASDHGLSQSHSHFDTLGFMRKSGYKTLGYTNVLKYFTDADSACMISGNAMCNLYVKSPEGWSRRSTFEEMEALTANLLEREEIDILAGVDCEGRTRIKSRRGEALAWLDEKGLLNYKKLKGDPFGYNGVPAKMTTEQALDRTYGTDYPDAIEQLVQIMESPRTGDLVLSAASGYDLRATDENPEHYSSHGSLHRDHMIMPLVINHKLKRENVRSVDIYPTILELMGHPLPDNCDGISLA